MAGCASDQPTTSDGGGSEKVTVNFWSFLAAENAKAGEHFEQSLKNFESMNPNIGVNMQAISGGQMRNKLPSAVSAGNAPDLAEGGIAGLEFFLDGTLADHGSYVEGGDFLDGFTQANRDSMTYQGEYWSGGGNRHLVSMLAVRPKLFKDVGVDDPAQLETWTGYRRALEKMTQKHPQVYAYEATGAPNDLESYWGEARTAYSGGEDPWFDSKAWENPTDSLKVGQAGRTDGMIKNIIDMANAYSSEKAATRSDEQVPPLLLTDQAASFTYGLGNPVRYRSVEQDVTFGWDGDIWQGPIPKLDANYGQEFGIDELAGKEGAHGGHLWAIQMMKQAFGQDHNKPEQAFKLMTYLNTSADHNLTLLAEDYPALAAYKPLNQKLLSQYGDSMPQIQKVMYDLPKQYGSQYNSAGANWDLRETSQIRWTDLNQTISEGIAGQHSPSGTVEAIKNRITKTLSK
ncbi:ABC transporter substrate-binding protein [Halomarina pelagica]|uniref:ABC transporter substrate-binding protein n=1 Tax=Halomarina pelagica TaxID=2961599 RepID=UPI0020C3F5F8|nr:extracellular solute-binding protein [Halomarina sp. BND7]